MPDCKFTVFAQTFSENVFLRSENSAKIDNNYKLNLGWGLEFLIWLCGTLEHEGVVAIPTILPFMIVLLTYGKTSFTLAYKINT